MADTEAGRPIARRTPTRSTSRRRLKTPAPGSRPPLPPLPPKTLGPIIREGAPSPADQRLAQTVSDLVDARLALRTKDALRRVEAQVAARLAPLVDERLSQALAPRLAEIRGADTAVLAPVEIEDAAVESRVASLAESIESAAAKRALDALTPTIEEKIAERLKRETGKLAVPVSSPGRSPDTGLDEKLAALEAKLSKLVESKALLVSERLDEHMTRKLEILSRKDDSPKAVREAKGPSTPRLPDDPTVVAREVARVLPNKLSELGANLAAGAEAHARAAAERATRLIDDRAQKIAQDCVAAFEAFEKRIAEKVESLVADLVDVRLTAELPPAAAKMKFPTEDVAHGVARSEVLKAALDARFRVMLVHLENEVVPRVLKKTAKLPPREEKVVRRDEKPSAKDDFRDTAS